jgi:hypothetical protein
LAIHAVGAGEITLAGGTDGHSSIQMRYNMQTIDKDLRRICAIMAQKHRLAFDAPANRAAQIARKIGQPFMARGPDNRPNGFARPENNLCAQSLQRGGQRAARAARMQARA